MSVGEKTKFLWQNPKYRKRMSEAHKGNSGYWTGKKLLPHMIKALVKARKGRPSWNKGIPMSEVSKNKLIKTLNQIGHTFTKLTAAEEKKRLKNLRIGKKSIIGKYAGDKCCHWQGGISKLPYAFEFNQGLKDKIRQRDNHQCVNCSMTEEEHLIVIGRVLVVHHIDYNKLNCQENNLITLCNQCNTRANFNRDYWYAYYTQKIEVLVGA